MQPAAPQHIDQLCLQCGLCCDGTLFRDVELSARDRISPLKEAGIQIRSTATKKRFPQPCAALGSDLRCSVYSARPCHCRTFECGLLLRVSRSECEVETALRTIRKAKRLQSRILRLLHKLGETDETSPLKRRFERLLRGRTDTENRGRSASDQQTDHLHGDLSVAMHELNLILAQHFYQ